MRHKLDYIESICNEADIICLTETHLDQNITNDGIFIEGYCKDPYRKDRNNSGGGVIVYFSNHLIVQPRADLNFDSEAIWLEIVFPDCCFMVTIFSIYLNYIRLKDITIIRY
jgi:exonuclease III